MAKRELKISEEQAKIQLEMYFDWYGLDYDEMFEAKDGGKLDKARESVRKHLIKRIRQGYIEIKEEADKDGSSSLVVLQHLDHVIQGKREVKYNEIRGKHRSAVQVLEGENETAQAYRVLGVLTGEGKAFFESLRGADIGITDMLSYLFLLV